MKSTYPVVLAGFALSLATVSGQTYAPYAPDADTVYLFHLDETSGSDTAGNVGSAGHTGITTDDEGTTVTDVLTGAVGTFGNAANGSRYRAIGIDADGSGSFTTGGADRFNLSQLLGDDNAFTLEALVRPDTADFNWNAQIWCADSGLTNNRGFQFRIKNTEELEYNGIDFGGGHELYSLTNLQAGDWYHAALTYTEAGQTAGIGLFTMYWTPLAGSPTQAQAVHSWTGSAITPNFSSQLVLGNEGREAFSVGMTEGFPGLIDEARISRVARAANEFIFSVVDSDGDGLPDSWEQQIIDADLSDAITEVIHVLPGGDFDMDTLTNQEEYDLGTDPTIANDLNNIDGDGLPDSWELTYFPTIQSQNDTGNPDGDIYNNLQEYQLGKNPTVFDDPNDSDSDGLPDDWEQQIVEANFDDAITDITDVFPGDDYDSDGFTNAQELAAGTDPDNSASVPGDGDADGLSDEWESIFFGGLGKEGIDDPDGDGHNNSAEQAAGTDPNDPLDFPGAAVDPSRPTGLMVDLIALPHRTTIPDTAPEFAWIFHPIKRNNFQTAYQVIVSSTALLAGAGTGDVWDSGQVTSGDSVDVEYAGSALNRGSSYAWRVRTWGDGSGPSAWSAIQQFTIESTNPQSGARSIYKSSANDGTGYSWAGRYQSSFDSVVIPTLVIDKGSDDYFVDFGRDGFGYLTLRLNGNFAGQSMTVKFSEHASGNTLLDAGGSTTFTSKTVSLQDGDVTYEIRTPDVSGGNINVDRWAGGVIAPFRYVELVGCPATVTTSDLRQHVLHVPFDDNAAAFSSSDATLDAVWELCRYSMKATSFASAYVDGDRERLPYEADAYINQLSHYAVDREFTTARLTYEWLLDHPTWPTEWRLHFPLMAWADFMQTGNRDALEANYDSLKSQLFLGWTRSSDGLFKSQTSGTPRDIVDWPTTERDGYVFTNINTVVNAFHYKALRLMSLIATETGHTADATDFTTRADTMEASFNSVLWNGSLYQDGETATHISAHANFFPMAMGLVPDNRVAAVMAFLKTKRMACSVYAAQYLLEALFEGGEADYAIGLMTDTDPIYKRHWWNMIVEGSTITMEAWGQAYKPNQDWNHAWGAVPGNIIPRYVLGLKPITAGFAHVEIKPQLGTGDGTDGLTSATGTIPTIRGPVEIDVENSATEFKLQVSIPGNMTARIRIPTKGHANATLLYDGTVVAATEEDGHLVLDDVPAGTHSIWLSDTATPDEATLKENWKTGMFGADASNSSISGDELDPDNDSQTTLNEFYANTDPLDRSDQFHIRSFQPDFTTGVFEMTLPGKSGRHYLLQRTTELNPADWTQLDSATTDTPGDLILNDNSLPSGPRAFYRAGVELP